MTPADLRAWWEANPNQLVQIAASVHRKTRNRMNHPGDLAGATYVAAIDSLRRHIEPRRSVGGWLHSVMFNTAREIIGHEKRDRRVLSCTPAVNEAPAPEYNLAESMEYDERLAWTRARLTPRDFEIVTMAAAGEDRTAIAERIGMSKFYVTRRRKELVVGIREGKHIRKSLPWFNLSAHGYR